MKKIVMEHVPKYQLLPELEKASCGMIFGQLMIGDTTEAKREIDKLFPGKIQANVSVAGEERGHHRRTLQTSEVCLYGRKCRELLDSGAVPNILSKELAGRLGV